MKKIFIGSSTNSVYIARDIQKILQKLGAETTLWTDVDAFRLSYNTLEELIHAARTHSGGVFIFNTDDEIISRGSAGSTQFIPRDNVIAEAGIFAGVLGMKAVALCTIDDVHVASDFHGITTLEYNNLSPMEKEKKLKNWLDNNVSEYRRSGYDNNVLMLEREKIHDIYSIDSRLHITDKLYKNIKRVRIMNFASNLLINPLVGEKGHIPTKDISLSQAMEAIMREADATVELILTEPNPYNLQDLKSKIANQNAGSEEGALYSALATMYKNLTTDTIYREKASEIPVHFWLYTLNISMPFGIFNVEFLDETKYNHVKVDLYSAALHNENERRSFVIWEKDDPDNYNFFVNNFDDIKGNPSLCTPHRNPLDTLKQWAEEWEKMKPGGLK